LEGLSDAEKRDVLNQALKILPNFHALKSPMFIKDWKRTIAWDQNFLNDSMMGEN
jgi:hypothetical protein